MKKYQVAVFGSLIKDIEFFSDEVFVIENKKDLTRQKMFAFEYGAKLPIDKVYYNFGGGAGNVSFGLNKLGIKVAPVGCVGDDSDQMLENFKKNGIDVSLILKNKKELTGFSFILGSKKFKDHVIFTHKGASANFSYSQTLLTEFKADYFYVAAQSQKNWEVELKKVFNKARKDASLIVWNPGQKQINRVSLMLPFLTQTEILIVNKDEAIQLVMTFFGKSSKLNNVKFLTNKLKQLGPIAVVVTEGAGGANLLDAAGKFYHLPAMGKNVVDTVGAGDAFGSGFLAGLIKYDHDAKKALDLGLKNSGAVVAKIGAQNGLLSK
ncbi:MAG TPA: PfkB family carbohydrate kinase [Candidatus Bipolaricaulota bacterium]|nr:PfkB family carbohydrate kinase [Candidatus Bipolaricaulota bacterium]